MYYPALTNPAAEPQMNPAHPTALAYRPMDRKSLETILNDLKLTGRRKLFTPGMLDCLYAQLDRIDKDFAEVKPVPAPAQLTTASGKHVPERSFDNPTFTFQSPLHRDAQVRATMGGGVGGAAAVLVSPAASDPTSHTGV